MLATDTIAMFDTGQAELIVEYIDPDDPEAKGLVGRFTAFSFTVTNMETAVANLRVHPIEMARFARAAAVGRPAFALQRPRW
jgi:hypothetical protein